MHRATQIMQFWWDWSLELLGHCITGLRKLSGRTQPFSIISGLHRAAQNTHSGCNYTPASLRHCILGQRHNAGSTQAFSSMGGHNFLLCTPGLRAGERARAVQINTMYAFCRPLHTIHCNSHMCKRVCWFGVPFEPFS